VENKKTIADGGVKTMRIVVIVKTGKKKEKITVINDNALIVETTKLPHDNQANKDVIKQLASHYDVAQSCVALVRGATLKEKVFDIAIEK